MVAGRSVEQPQISGQAKGHVYSGVAPRDGVGNRPRDLIQRNIINTKPPHEVVDVADVFLMRFWGQECLEEPFAVVDLTDVAKLCKGRNALAHNRDLAWSVMDLLNTDGAGTTRVNDALVVLDRKKQAFVIKDRPIAFNEAEDLGADGAVQMGEVQFSSELRAMRGLAICGGEARVNVVQRGRRVLALVKDGAAVDTVQKHIEIMRLIRETAIVIEDILALGTASAGGNADGLVSRNGAEHGRRGRIR